MSWKGLLEREIEHTYRVTEDLIDLVDEGRPDWKPSQGSNWMTTAQLLRHIAQACGVPFRGFVRGDWDMPEGVDMRDVPAEAMLPPAEAMPTVGSVEEAKRLLAEDRRLALDVLGECEEDDLARKAAPAPWDPTQMILGHRLLQMVDHLRQHKAQLFYYLKLQGKPVGTADLWGK